MLIDPGHGGKDAGATKGSIYEKNVALAYAMNLGHFAEQSGRTVRYTRTTDKTLDLGERSRLVRPKEVLISCHVNSTESPSANGASVWYHGGESDSFVLGVAVFKRIMQTHLFRQYGAGVISDLTRYNNGFAVLRGAAEIGARAAILIEPGFLSNDKDRAILTSEKNRIILARAINDGITDFVESMQQ